MKNNHQPITRGDLIWIIILAIMIMITAPVVIDRLTEHDVYTCQKYAAPSMPEWCEMLFEQEGIKR